MVVAAVQRGRRGWAPRDTWSADQYICRVVGEILLYLSEHDHGWPGDEEFPTYEGWTSALRSHAEPLLLYAEKLFDDGDEGGFSMRHDGAQESLRWVADHLGSIWD